MGVISSCAKRDMVCARAAELLSLSVRQVRRLKKRLREHGEAALAHANRGRPSLRCLPSRVRQSVIRLARTTYAGFNDHHLCEKLCEVEGFSLSRETLRRLLRQAGLGSPRKRRAPAHRQRRLRSACEGELVQLDGSLDDWLEGRGPRLTALEANFGWHKPAIWTPPTPCCAFSLLTTTAGSPADPAMCNPRGVPRRKTSTASVANCTSSKMTVLALIEDGLFEEKIQFSAAPD